MEILDFSGTDGRGQLEKKGGSDFCAGNETEEM